MKLLITTQAVDLNDPVLGFFHRWIEEFAKHFEHIHVVCLKEGKHSLPDNVTVYSLGKEHGGGWVRYISTFLTHMWELRGKYDSVFSHMNPHYIVMFGLVWRLCGKEIFFWRNHAKMNWMTRFAAPLSKNVFYTSPFACTARYSHAVQMPVGIDTDIFSVSTRNRTNSKKILSLGRISPVKKIELLIEAAHFLPAEYEVHIYGDAPEKDVTYMKDLIPRAGKNVFFHGSVRNEDTPKIYAAHDVFVNLTPKGSMDKTVLEAASCGSLVVMTNESFLDTLPRISYLEDVAPEALAQKIVTIVEIQPEEASALARESREKIIKGHSLAKLAEKLYTYIHGIR